MARVGFDPQMHSFDMPIQIGSKKSLVVADFTCESRLDLHVDHFAMSLQVSRVVGFVVALLTMKSLDSLMHSFHVIVEEMLVDRFVLAEVA